jgi:putative membrane-bound dehydrogenase-like protein
MTRRVFTVGVVCVLALVVSARAEGPPSVAQALAAFRLADPSLKIELVAAEPDVVSPVAFAWDESGRLFVAEMTDYPAAPTGGRIKLLEDRDGDGQYERAMVFADKLPYPNSVLPWNGGILVTAAPDLLFLKDTDDDGKADVRRVVLTGFGEGNQQLRVNSPTWGLDNWVYLANGRSGGAVRRPGDPVASAVPIPRSDLRLKPDSGRFEPVAGFSQFGLPRDDRGDRFPSWNTVPIRHVVLEDRVFARDVAGTEHKTVADILDLADGGRIYSLAPTQKRFNAETVSYFNATCGPTIYRGGVLDRAYQGHAFICEPLTGVVHHRRLDPDGPTYKARRVEVGREFLASTHSWFRPVNLTTGPDGALYLADFCRAWVEHPAFVPEKLRNSVDFREGHEFGRLWRIAPRDTNARILTCRPGMDDTAGLIAHFAHSNGWCRDTAQRLLVTRKTVDAIVPLRALVRSSPVALARIHALWTLDGLDALDSDTLRAALADLDPSVREQAARLSEDRASQASSQLAALADDADPRVRLRVAVALASLDSDAAREALARIAAHDGDSPWTSEVVLMGISRDPARFLETLSTRLPGWLNAPTAAQARFLSRLAERVGVRNDREELDTVLAAADAARGDIAPIALVGGMARSQRSLANPKLKRTIYGVGEIDRDFVEHRLVDKVKAVAHAAVGNGARPSWVRVLALEALVQIDFHPATFALVDCLESKEPAELQAAAILELARQFRQKSSNYKSDLLAKILAGWDSFALSTRRSLVGLFVTKADTASLLLVAIDKGDVSPAELDPTAFEALQRLPDFRIKAWVEAHQRSRPVADRREVVLKGTPALALKPDAERGRTLFTSHCQTCHARDGNGPKVGPDLLSVAGRPPEDLLVAILDPAREAAPDGLGVVVVTTRGQTLTGLLAEETPAAVRLKRAGGLEDVIPRSEIEALRPTGRSLMPDGFEQVLAPQDLADLIAFLRTPPRPTP